MKKVWIVLAVLCLLTTAVMGVSASAKTAVVYGDINNDGDVNNRDLALLQKYLNNWEVEINEDAADVTADGDVNNRDLALLQKYLNNWEVNLGPDEAEEDDNIYNDTELDWN